MKFMLDTNICIYIIKKRPENVFNKFKQQTIDDICISSITLAELDYGVCKSQHVHKNGEALKEFIFPLEILAFDEHASWYYGEMRDYLTKKGSPIGSLDLLIAAHALSQNVTLVTNNKREFERVPKLKIEDWTSQ